MGLSNLIKVLTLNLISITLFDFQVKQTLLYEFYACDRFYTKFLLFKCFKKFIVITHPR